MGAWGAGIYSCDIAEDIREFCKEVYPFVNVEEGNRILFETYAMLLKSGIIDNEYASFWYVLADWQWKHGILTEKVRTKTLELLEQYVGLDDWLEIGDALGARKRRSVLDALKLQLGSPMPEKKLPKAKLKKPQHKPGDIIIFRACSRENDPDAYFWSISNLCSHHIFRDPDLAYGPEQVDEPLEAYDKYMAVLCVGTEKQPHSQYLEGLWDESSVYAVYDYLSEEKPTVETLRTCGFLPAHQYFFKDFNRKIHDYCGWTYTLTMYTSLFAERASFSESEKKTDFGEVARFHDLLNPKNYLSAPDRDFMAIYDIFKVFWHDKLRLMLAHRPIDNLLSEHITNPQLLTPQEADIAYREWSNRLFQSRNTS